MAKNEENPYNNPYNSPYNNPYQSPYNSPYNTPYNSPYNSPYNAPYHSPYNTPYNNPYSAAPYGGGGPQQEEEDGFNFNVMEWILRILHYWYLFVIAGIIAFGLGYLKNRRWMPKYLSCGTIIIKQSTPYGTNMGGGLMQGFGIDAGYTNVKNQMIMLGSYDLMARVVDSLPFLNVDYFTQGRFKTRNVYRQSPIIVEYDRIAPEAYSVMFRCSFTGDGRLTIVSTDEDMPFSVTTKFGEKIETKLFTATVWPTENMDMLRSGHIYFRFRSRSDLVNEFLSTLVPEFLVEGSTVLRLSLRSETPERDCEIIDKVIEMYLLQNLERKNMVAENSIRFIDSQLEILRGQLQVSEGAMTDFRQENKFVNVSTYAGTLMTQMAEYDKEQMALRLKETYLDYMDNYLKQQIEQGAVVAPASLGISEPMLTQFVTQLNDLQLQRSELSEKNVYYAKYTNDIEHVKEGLREVIKTMRASLEIEKKDLNGRYAEVEQNMKRLPEKELQMVSIERNYRIDDNYYTFFLQKRAEAEIQKASNTPDNDILDHARRSICVNSKDKRKTMTTYMIVGLLVPLVLIILSELLNDKVRTPKEAAKLGRFQLIGSLKHARNPNPTLVKANPRSRYAESLRSMRTRIEFIVQKKEKITLCVTSAESGDGKTFLCTNMAAMFAMTGKKTILVDLDIRKPNVHEKLGLPNGLGVTNYLIGDCSLDDIILKDTPFDFDVMRAGTVPPNPGELIHSDELTQMIKTLKERYDFVVIDTSPIGQVPDAYNLIDLADTTLFVIRCLQTSKALVKQTLEQLNIDHSGKVNLVLSDMPTEGYHHGYNYTYAYGYGSKYGYGGYGGKYGYGYGYGYGKNTGSKKSRWKQRYGYYYGKLMGKEEQAEHYNYYVDDDE